MRLRFTNLLTLIALAAVVAASAALLLGQAPARGAGAAPAAPPAQAGRGAAAAAPAQGRGAAPAGPAIPRTADGKPDFSGIWQVLDNSLDGSIEPHSASWGVHAGQGAITDTPDGMIPYTPAGLAKRNENFKNRAKDPVSQCWKPGVPRIMFQPFPFQITQAPKMIQMTFELVHNRRDIYINDSKHLEGIEFFNGDSRAKWDGDSLVVDVTNFMDDPTRETWLDGSGSYHSPALHVVERYTFNGPDMITYQARLEDPKSFTRPFTIEFLLYRHKGTNFRVLEYECQMFKEQLVKDGKAGTLRIVEGK
jgi:hypothetical protein